MPKAIVPTRLSNTAKATLKKASRLGIQQAYGVLQKHFRRSKWLLKKNRYTSDCVRLLKADVKVGGINHSDLLQYIAASAPLHCVDGWGFLGRAMAGLSHADGNSARHLGYYAELRGAVSLLASEGIGIFNDKHFVVDQTGQTVSVPQRLGTHQIAWLALEYWAGLERCADLLGQIIRPGSVPLREWLESLSAGHATSYIGRKWLREWGIDLKRISQDDHGARNEASYRPTRLRVSSALDAGETSMFLRSFWMLFEPAGPSRFEVLDRHLLRLSLEQAFKGMTGRKAADEPVDFRRRVLKMLVSISPGWLSLDEWEDFLIRKSETDTPLAIREAWGASLASDPRYHLQVMSRAGLLLRVAAGACERHLRESGTRLRDLAFWYEPLSVERGFWEPGKAPDQLVDLWADIEAAASQALSWETTNGHARAWYSAWQKEQSQAMLAFSGCERIAFWGLGL